MIRDELRPLYLDDALIALDKPAGLLAVPGRGEAGHDSLASRAQARWPDARVVHRLDMATSGLMLFARGLHAQRVVSRAFEQRRVRKRYEAVVQGVVERDAGEIDLPLACDWPRRPRQEVNHGRGRASLTRWQVLAREKACTRLTLEPVTGRSHQLRVHLAAIGHPIFGDALYGAADTAPRLLLHACFLALPHPSDETRTIELESAVPF